MTSVQLNVVHVLSSYLHIIHLPHATSTYITFHSSVRAHVCPNAKTYVYLHLLHSRYISISLFKTFNSWVFWSDANLINTPQWRHIHSLSSDSASTAYTCRVFPRTRVDNSRHQNLQWILKIPKGVTSHSLLTFPEFCVEAAPTNSEQTKCHVTHHTATHFTLQFSTFQCIPVPPPSEP